jgi:methionine sulfoxide reductase heme-binding subunit
VSEATAARRSARPSGSAPAEAAVQPVPPRPAARALALRALKPAAFAASCVPLAKLAVDAASGGLGANPIAEVMNRLGFWTLTFLALSLAPTPAKDLLGVSWPIRIRRMLGLFAFAYGTLHFAWYLGVDKFFDLAEIGKDIVKRKFITVGFSALLLLVPLAVTSTDRAVRRMGFRRWKRLHRLVYAAALLGVIHFVWRVKADLRKPVIFAAAVGLLLLARLAPAARRAIARRRTRRGALGPADAGAGAISARPPSAGRSRRP